MKIYILPIGEQFRPRRQPFRYPRHNRDYGVEQDFYEYLLHARQLHTPDPAKATWHYLPVFWTRWHLRHKYGATGREELRTAVENAIIDDGRTFTICQYDDGPLVELGSALQFLASRRTPKGIDIPLLASEHTYPLFPPKKRYRASFVGRFDTHPLRTEMGRILSARKDVFLYDGNRGSRFFVKTLLASYLALSPRGYGGSSFRFFEAMQLGVVPCLVGDLDTRPFSRFIRWNEISYYAHSVSEVQLILDGLALPGLEKMGRLARTCYREKLAYRKWCELAVRELEYRAQ
jgi:hypothetical protein